MPLISIMNAARNVISGLLLMLTGTIFATAGRAQPVDETRPPGDAGGGLRLVQTLPLPDVEGRIDHLAVDLKRMRLFVAALGNDTVEVVDLRLGKTMQSLAGFSEPQGVLFLAETDELYVTNGGSGVCQVFDGESLAPKGRIEFSGDADNLRYDPDSRSVVVGYGSGRLGIVDVAGHEHVGDVELDGHPESFQLARSSAKLFVNVPGAGQIAVVDRTKRAVVARWTLGPARANFPMALDESGQRLFVGFRQPAQLAVYDTESGNAIARLESVGDVDDIFVDAARRRLYLVGGEGFVDLVEEADGDHYRRTARIPTGAGARTGLFVPEWSRLYVAVPHRGRQPAEVRIFEVQP